MYNVLRGGIVKVGENANVNLNKRHIRKLIIVASVVILILVEGYVLIREGYKNVEKNKKSDTGYPYLKQITGYIEPIVEKKVVDGVTYVAPDGYSIEVVNNNVHAVKRYYLVDKPKTEVVDTNGREVYVVPDDYLLVDGLLYREIVEYAEPIIEQNKQL